MQLCCLLLGQKNGEDPCAFCYPLNMSDIEAVDISGIKFTSTVFPTPGDMELWESLTYEQRKAVEIRDVEEGRASGLSEPCTMSEIIAEAKAEMNGG